MDYLKIEKEEKIAVVSINRPDALNSLNQQLLEELEEAISLLEEDTGIQVLIITGRGKAFAAGADIEEMLEMSPLSAKEFSQLGQRVFSGIAESRLISIAAVNGYALGGGSELALACDLRIASRKAIFGQPEVSLGITAGFGGTQRLPRIVGEAKAKEILFTGRRVTAEEALQIGLINTLVSEEKLLLKARELALRIVKNAPLALRKTKKAVNYSISNLAEGMKREQELFAECFTTFDQKEGIKAFLQKRQARFEGK